jgi:hypothetical protein
MYHKRIVVDFDDTLAFHQNRKFDEALPNKPLIEKLNKLHSEDWQIDIFTARGSISCKTREDARKKYEKSMLNWLDKNNVKFNILSFDKIFLKLIFVNSRVDYLAVKSIPMVK